MGQGEHEMLGLTVTSVTKKIAVITSSLLFKGPSASLVDLLPELTVPDL